MSYKFTCPSCGRVEHIELRINSNIDGKWYHFCSQECAKSFKKNVRKRLNYYGQRKSL